NNTSSINNYVSDLERTISQNYYFNLRDESTLTRADSYCNSEINKMLLKRRKEEETENDQAKKQKIQEYTYDDDTNLSGDDSNLNEVEIDLNDKNFNNVENNKEYRVDITAFSLIASRDIFKMEFGELADVVPHLQKVCGILKEKLNINARIHNSNMELLKELIEKELKNADEEDLQKIKVQYDSFKEDKFLDPKNVDFHCLSLENKLKKRFIFLDEIYNSLDKCLHNYKILDSFIKTHKRILNVISKITTQSLYNLILFGKFLLPSGEKNSRYNIMFKSIYELIQHVEKVQSSLSRDKNIIYNPKKQISSALKQLGKFRRRRDAFFKYLKRTKLSCKNRKRILQIVFYFLQERNKKNRNIIKEIEKDFPACDIIDEFHVILLKEKKHILESLERASEYLKLNEELDINKKSVGPLLKNKYARYNAFLLYKTFMSLVRYSSIRYLHSISEGIYINVRRLISAENIRRLSKKTDTSKKLQNEILHKLKNFKDELSKVELDIIYRSLYNEFKEDISCMSKSARLLCYNINEWNIYLMNLKKSLNDYLLLKREGEDVGKMEESILYMLFHTNEIMNECWINEIE
ncbi:surface-associated interspersed protein (SURFIN), partial [Plasmodium relictum]